MFDTIGGRRTYQERIKINKCVRPGVVSQGSHLQRCSVPKDPLSPETLDELRRIGRTIAGIREWRNLTQEELRTASGVSYRQVQRIEGGHSDVSVSAYLRIAKALRVPAFLLFTTDWPQYIDDDVTAPAPTPRP